jgi:hypothetical protein
VPRVLGRRSLSRHHGKRLGLLVGALADCVEGERTAWQRTAGGADPLKEPGRLVVPLPRISPGVAAAVAVPREKVPAPRQQTTR